VAAAAQCVAVLTTAVGETAAYVNDVPLERGVEVSIRGRRGRFKFLRATTTTSGQIVCDFIGGTAGHESWRSFYPDRITIVHNSNTMRHTARSRK
jgi:hypothetical protein